MFSLHGFGPSFLSGTIVTLKLGICSFLIGLVLGLIGAFAKRSSITSLRYLATAYTTIIRGCPELLIIFLIFYGGQILISQIFGSYIEIPAFLAGALALGSVFGGYATEVLRSSFEAIPIGLIEAGEALGMTSRTIFFRIQAPLVCRYALPAIGNLWLVILKETALVSIIGLEDIMRKSQIAVSNTKKAFTFYFIAALIYLILTFISEVLIKIWKKHLFREESSSL